MAQTPSSDQAPKKSCPARARGLAFKLAALGLVAVSALAGTGLARWLRSPGTDVEEGAAVGAGKMPAGLFRGWPKKKPDLVLVVTGQQHGYLLPCGCSEPQIGGLERRYNFLKMLEREGWPVVALDLGDVAQEKGVAWLPNQQALVKYRFAMNAMDRMKYVGVGLGRTEAAQTYFRVLGEWALNNPTPPVVSANLIDADTNFPGQTKTWASAGAGGVKVGATSITGPLVAKRILALAGPGDRTMNFSNPRPHLNKALAEMRKDGVGLPVLLYQGALTGNDFKRPPTEAMAAAEAYPQFPLIVCLSSEDEPPALPFRVSHPETKTTSLVIQVGRRGKFLGVVGVFKTGNPGRPFDFHYQMVEMTPDWATPDADKGAQPIVQLMEEYAKEIKRDNYLSRYGGMTHPLQAMAVVKDGGVPLVDKAGKTRPTFVGSAVCRNCHKKEHKIWENSGHAHAYQKLVDAKHPSNRQFDPECIVCHTVGFGFDSGFRDTTTTAKFTDVGCESCHGPASIHVANKDNEEWHKRLNPWRHLPAAVREREMNLFCQKCHDQDNDVTWLKVGFPKKWQKIAH